MWNSDFTRLVSTLFCIGNLIFYLNGAGTSFYHSFGQKIGRLFITKTGVDVGNYRDNMGLVIVNAINNALSVTAILSGFVQLCEDVPKLSCIGLFQKGIDLLDQVSDSRFLVHTLIRQRTEFGPERRYHPAG